MRDLNGDRRLSSAAFQNYTNSNTMSVGLADEMSGYAELLEGHEGYGVAEFTAGYTRKNCGQVVVRAPEQNKPWHAHVVGVKSKTVKKRLRDGSKVMVKPKEK